MALLSAISLPTASASFFLSVIGIVGLWSVVCYRNHRERAAQRCDDANSGDAHSGDESDGSSEHEREQERERRPTRPFFLMAHRGWRGPNGENDENTLEAVVAAAKRPALQGVEVDVMITSDGVPYLMHDDTLARTTGDHRRAEDVSVEDLRTLTTLSRRQALPLLHDVLVHLLAAVEQRGNGDGQNPFWFYLDIKSERADAVAVVESILRERGVDKNHPRLRVVVIHTSVASLVEKDAINYYTASFSGYKTDFAAPFWPLYLAWPLRDAFVWTVNYPVLIDLVRAVGAMAVITDLPL